ncbi:hypothetical protein DID74_01680 [Candidatus Marinamargulisbacteria bacterium SCGC AG-333-B06]|nr:hypothetical protein DID74_01680 [Candidatus Marinamargulisbacteria bacterium SCGC AG-333-B06]
MIQSPTKSLFSKTIANNSFSHSYLFYGTNSLDLKSSCIDLVKDYLNVHHSFSLQPTDSLPSHPDIIFIEDDSSIKIDHIKLLQETIKYGPYEFNYCFVIIPNCDLCTPQASNAFLKTLEEPINNVLFLLTSAHFQSILPTIRSRSSCVYIPTQPMHHLADDYSTFQSFKSLDLTKRFERCYHLSTDKQTLITHLHNWLVELQHSSRSYHRHDMALLLDLLETLQYNVNVRLQLEHFSLQLPFH